MNKKLKIIRIEGIPDKLFDKMKNLGLELEIHTEGPQNEWQRQVVEYLIVSTIVFPYDFVRDFLKDQTKILATKVAAAILDLWNKVKFIKPAWIESGREPEYKQPKLKIVFPISKDESSTLELSSQVSDCITEKTMVEYFQLLTKQIENRKEEDKIIANIKLTIKTNKH